MATDTDKTPILLAVAMPASIHAARWINTIRQRGYRIVLFPGVLQPLCPEFEPARPVRCRADLEILQPGEIGVYPNEDVVALTEAEVENPKVYPYAIPVMGLPANKNPSPNALCEAISAFEPDLIHSMELQHSGYLTLESKRRLKAAFPPWLASSWGSDIFLYRRLEGHRSILHQLLAQVDSLHSDCARDMVWAKKAGFGGDCFPQMPASAGVDFALYPHPSELPRPSQRKTIVIKGYHSWAGRGLHILLAIHLIAPELSGFKILVTHGTRVIADMVERLASEHGLDIIIAPHVETNAEAVARIATARLVVGYGISDGISTTLLESMAVGAFMIQAKTCCGNEWIAHGRTGMLVPPHDVTALAEAILLVIKDDSLVDRAVVRNRQVVEARWNAQTNGAIIDTAYRKLIAERAHE